MVYKLEITHTINTHTYTHIYKIAIIPLGGENRGIYFIHNNFSKYFTMSIYFSYLISCWKTRIKLFSALIS